jgi:hypothetical protein
LVIVGVIPEGNIWESQEEKKEKKAKDEGKKEKN